MTSLLLLMCFALPFEIRLPNRLSRHPIDFSDLPLVHTFSGFEQKIGIILLLITVLLLISNFLSDSQHVKKLRIILSALMLIGVPFEYLEIIFEWSTVTEQFVGYGFFVFCVMVLINMLVQLRCRIQYSI